MSLLFIISRPLSMLSLSTDRYEIFPCRFLRNASFRRRYSFSSMISTKLGMWAIKSSAPKYPANLASPSAFVVSFVVRSVEKAIFSRPVNFWSYGIMSSGWRVVSIMRMLLLPKMKRFSLPIPVMPITMSRASVFSATLLMISAVSPALLLQEISGRKVPATCFMVASRRSCSFSAVLLKASSRSSCSSCSPGPVQATALRAGSPPGIRKAWHR